MRVGWVVELVVSWFCVFLYIWFGGVVLKEIELAKEMQVRSTCFLKNIKTDLLMPLHRTGCKGLLRQGGHAHEWISTKAAVQVIGVVE